MEIVAVIDFETTGLSPGQGDRATEVAAVIVEGGRVVDRYQSLMNAGVRIPAYIEALTGISNAMIRTAPSAQDVMRAVSDFVGGIPIVAHNAAFDSRFWDAELARIQRSRKQDFICSLLLSRRIFPLAPSHKLGALIEYARLPVAGRYHRALADAEMATELLGRSRHDLMLRHGVARPDHAFLCALQACSKAALPKFFARQVAALA